MQNKHKPPITNIGSVSLIMIFIVLCMVIFAILSLSESTGDYKFTEKLASHTTDYYTASSQAERALAEIDTLLHETGENAIGSETLFYQNVIEAINNTSISSINDLSATFDHDEVLYISYDVPVGDSQKLYVRLRVNAPQTSTAAAYTITTWQTLQTDEWNGDDSIQLIK